MHVQKTSFEPCVLLLRRSSSGAFHVKFTNNIPSNERPCERSIHLKTGHSERSLNVLCTFKQTFLTFRAERSKNVQKTFRLGRARLTNLIYIVTLIINRHIFYMNIWIIGNKLISCFKYYFVFKNIINLFFKVVFLIIWTGQFDTVAKKSIFFL